MTDQQLKLQAQVQTMNNALLAGEIAAASAVLRELASDAEDDEPMACPLDEWERYLSALHEEQHRRGAARLCQNHTQIADTRSPQSALISMPEQA